MTRGNTRGTRFIPPKQDSQLYRRSYWVEHMKEENANKIRNFSIALIHTSLNSHRQLKVIHFNSGGLFKWNVLRSWVESSKWFCLFVCLLVLYSLLTFFVIKLISFWIISHSERVNSESEGGLKSNGLIIQLNIYELSFGICRRLSGVFIKIFSWHMPSINEYNHLNYRDSWS